jgi:hypothetical protein
MRNVLFKTENLTGVIDSENPVVRSLFNHLGPYIGGAELVQENSTARMSRVAIGYRDSLLSVNHAHPGGLHAGDRVPDMRVRHRTGARWEQGSLFDVLDPSGFVLLVAHGDETTVLAPELRDIASEQHGLVKLVELAPEAAARATYETALGRCSSVFLVRPDGYVGLAAGEHLADAPMPADAGRSLLDPACVQVLFADLQPGIGTNPPEELARSAVVLAEVPKLLRLPIHVSVVPDDGRPPELVPELAQHGEGVPLRSRMSASPFLDEATRDAIAATGPGSCSSPASRRNRLRDGSGGTTCGASCDPGRIPGLRAGRCLWRHVGPHGECSFSADRGGRRRNDVGRRACDSARA